MSLNESVPVKTLIEIESGVPTQHQNVPAALAPNPDNPPWGILQALIVWVVSIMLLLVIPLMLLAPYFFYRVLSDGSAEQVIRDPNLIFLSIVGVLPAHALTFLLVWYVVTSRGRRSFWKALGWSWPPEFGPRKTIGLAVTLFAGGWLLTYFLGGAETQLDQIIKSSYKARFLIAFLAAATGPFVEELIYRGVLYPALQRILGVLGGVIVVSILFTGVHVLQYINNFGVIAVIAILSVALTLVRARTGQLLPSYVIHLVFNGIQALFLMLQPLIEKTQLAPQAIPGFL
ncbi:MAG: lysostaphin resistance A-like protein, partial [Pyrinomonadaceae bacterium]